MRNATHMRIIAAALLLSAASCAPPPVTRYYLLDAPPAPTRAESVGEVSSGWFVGVRTFVVDPPYDQQRIVYRVGVDSAEVGFYAYHRWAAPLERMLPLALAGALRGVPPIRAAEPMSPRGGYDAYVEGRLLSLEEIDLPDGQRVVARLDLALRDGRGRILWSERLNGAGTTRAGEVRAVVETMNEVLSGQLALAAQRIGEVLARSSPPPPAP